MPVSTVITSLSSLNASPVHPGNCIYLLQNPVQMSFCEVSSSLSRQSRSSLLHFPSICQERLLSLLSPLRSCHMHTRSLSVGLLSVVLHKGEQYYVLTFTHTCTMPSTALWHALHRKLSRQWFQSSCSSYTKDGWTDWFVWAEVLGGKILFGLLLTSNRAMEEMGLRASRVYPSTETI